MHLLNISLETLLNGPSNQQAFKINPDQRVNLDARQVSIIVPGSEYDVIWITHLHCDPSLLCFIAISQLEMLTDFVN